MNFSEMLNIGLMQGFAGLSLFAVLLLMGLGLAIIFGQMGVINMAHGEFMTIGAYTVFMFSTLAESMAPGLMPYYFPVSIVAAFVFAFALGWVVEPSYDHGVLSILIRDKQGLPAAVKEIHAIVGRTTMAAAEGLGRPMK